MIPKTIHCCWFGGPKTPLAEKCQASWRRFAPDWRVREWNEKDAAGFSDLPGWRFFEEAMSRRKWAFAADWLRMAVLWRDGGIYCDCDLEFVGPAAALPLEGEFVAGQWLPDGSVGVEPAAIALEKGSAIARLMLDYYASVPFSDSLTTGEILAVRLRESNLALRTLAPEVLSPIDVRGVCHRTAATVGIHRCAMSWVTPQRRLARWLAWHGMRGLVEAVLRLKNGGRTK